MAAGLGFKDFVTGEVLTAADVDGYLMQGTWVFANAAARSAAVTSPQEGNMSYLKDTNSTEYYSGSAWVAIGGASGGLTLLETLTLSGASVTSSSIAGTYKNLYLVVKNLKPANDGDGCYVRFNSDSGASRYLSSAASGSQTAAAFTGDWTNLAVGTDNSTATGLSVATIYDYANTTTWKMIIIDSLQNNATTVTQVNYRRYAGFYNQTGAITTLQFLPDSGNFTSGSILIYGVN